MLPARYDPAAVISAPISESAIRLIAADELALVRPYYYYYYYYYIIIIVL